MTEALPAQPARVPGKGPTAAEAAPAAGPGAPLPEVLRAKMERALGADFSGVRVHEASPSASAMGAQAYAHGDELHFAPGRYDPVSQAGQELIGHELAHVVQQRQGRVNAPQGKGAPVVEDAALEAEADTMGRLAASSQPAAGAAAGPTVQRAVAPGAAAIQGKFQYDDNPQSGAPSSVYQHMREDIQRVMKEAVVALPDEATQAQARDAARNAFHAHNYRPDNHTLEFDNDNIFLRDNHNVRIDKLGILADSNQPALYLEIPAEEGDVNRHFINKSDGREYVLDAHGRYTPRFQTRSITVGDKARLNHRNALAPATPDGGRTPAQHVGGMDSQFLSITNSQGDVTNAHGAYFNAGGTGRIEIDLLQIESDNIVDLSTQAGAIAELRNALGVNTRPHFPEIWEAAQAQIRLIDAAPLAGKAAAHQTASGTNPGHGLTGMQWQQILDVCRTKEVLVAGGIPFAAVTAFRDGLVDLNEGPRGEITEHQQAAGQRTQTAQQALATHKAAVRTPRGRIGAAIRTRINVLKQRIRARFRHEVAGYLATRPGDRGPRRQVLTGAEQAGRAALAALALQHENRIAHGVIGEDAGIVALGTAAQQLVTNTMQGIPPLPHG